MTVAAFAWGVALLVAAFLVPVYTSTSDSGPTGANALAASSTLVGVNGLGVLVPVAIPALLAGVIGFALHRKCSRGSRASGRLAWALTWLLVAVSVLTGFTIGIFVLPLAGLLVGAACLTPSGARPGGPIGAA